MFISLRVLSETSKTCYFHPVSTLLLSAMVLLTNSSFILILSDSHKGCLIWVKFVEIPKQKFESHLSVESHLLALYSLIKYAVSTNQSARYMETSL